MPNTFNIPTVGVSELQFRLAVISALDSLAAGTGLATNSITLDKLQQIANNKILGNKSGSTGNVTQVDDAT